MFKLTNIMNQEHCQYKRVWPACSYCHPSSCTMSVPTGIFGWWLECVRTNPGESEACALSVHLFSLFKSIQAIHGPSCHLKDLFHHS